MNKDIKIIIIGFGSIGRRHYKNLQRLGYKNVHAFDVEKRKLEPGIKTIEQLTTKAMRVFDIAFICTPTHFHIKTALIAARAGCHLFIEKPLSNDLKDVDKLISICKQKKLIVMVGCNMRFEPCIKKIKELLEKKFLGKIYAIYLEYGRYLPYQRLGVDYKKVYASNKKMGGGIMLDDIHDFDLLFWFNNFAKVIKAQFLFDRLSDLQIDVEDICMSQIKFQNNIFGSIRCDYLQQYKNRICKIIGEKGNLAWDFRDNVLYFEYFGKNNKEVKKKVFAPHSKNPNQPYIDELEYFLGCIEKQQPTFNDIEKSLLPLRLILEAQEK